jgi:hypothetical protein
MLCGNCSMEAEFAMAVRRAGRTYTQLVREIIDLALSRYRRD